MIHALAESAIPLHVAIHAAASPEYRQRHIVQMMLGWGQTERLIAMIREAECGGDELAAELESALDDSNAYKEQANYELAASGSSFRV